MSQTNSHQHNTQYTIYTYNRQQHSTVFDDYKQITAYSSGGQHTIVITMPCSCASDFLLQTCNKTHDNKIHSNNDLCHHANRTGDALVHPPPRSVMDTRCICKVLHHRAHVSDGLVDLVTEISSHKTHMSAMCLHCAHPSGAACMNYKV